MDELLAYVIVVAIALAALYAVIRLAVTHAILAADRKRGRSEPGPDRAA